MRSQKRKCDSCAPYQFQMVEIELKMLTPQCFGEYVSHLIFSFAESHLNMTFLNIFMQEVMAYICVWYACDAPGCLLCSLH